MAFDLEINVTEFLQMLKREEPNATVTGLSPTDPHSFAISNSAKQSSDILLQKACLIFDSREIISQSENKAYIFWALVGKTFNPHKGEILQEVFNKGAVMAVVNAAETETINLPFVKVGDTSKALLKFASGYRKKFKNLKVVGVTGSAGKTSTREMIAAVLGRKYNTLATKGNLNNLFGVPMTLLGIKNENEAAVIEMGTSEKGEIHQLSLCAAPDIAVITNVAPAHLEGLGDLDGVFAEKKSIADGLAKGGRLVINADDEKLCRIRATQSHKIVTFGVNKGVVRPDEIAWENGYANFRIGRTWFKLGVPGIHNLYNALAAIAVGEILRVPKTVISEALAEVKSYDKRMQILENGGVEIISDCYNANPQSMKFALQTFANIPAKGRKIAVLGDMKELGQRSAEFHKEIGREIPVLGIDYLIAIGRDAEEYCSGAEERGMKSGRIRHFEDKSLAIENIKQLVREGDCVLVKASRSMKLEDVVNALTARETLYGH